MMPYRPHSIYVTYDGEVFCRMCGFYLNGFQLELLIERFSKEMPWTLQQWAKELGAVARDSEVEAGDLDGS